jgi:hypothetical protein
VCGTEPGNRSEIFQRATLPISGFGRTIRSEVPVGHLILIAVVASSFLLGLWYGVFARYNRRKGTAALRWVQIACRGRGKVLDSVWSGNARLRARLQFPSRWFENAHLTVSLMPRALPVQWLVSCWRKQKETLTFEADLDCPPGFRLDVLNHRWCGRSSRASSDSAEWEIHRPGPVVLTTRAQWTQELTPVVNALMASREHHFVDVHFRPDSPNFSATVALDSLNDPDAASGFLTILRELAAGASAKQL